MERRLCLFMVPAQIPLHGLKFFWIILFLIGFNFWHSANRGIWNLSIRDSLTIGSNTVELAKKTDPLIRPWKSYDGQFYYAIAFDPLLATKKIVASLDDPIYRYRRMFYSLCANMVALGNPIYFPHSLFFINLLSWLSIGMILWKLAQWENFSLPLLLSVGGIFTSGLTYTAFRTLPETLMMCLSLWGCYLWRKKSFNFSAVLFSLAVLTREVAAIIPLTIAFYNLIRMEEPRTKNIIRLILILILPVLWWGYLSFRLPAYVHSDIHRISFPFIGMFHELSISFNQQTSRTEHIRSISIVIETILLIGLVFLWYRRYPTFWGTLAVAQALFCSAVKGDIWNYHASSARVIIPLTLFTIIWLFEILKLHRPPEQSLIQS